ncbi:hypothetical protein AG1IA_02056 [Rhizoctonia solani AG-1 IA]|uniref:Uncharacterized protein n=1 Tax=Thanatephorus cucumeris (strain AG1-IA) TaxID=983506 RepID=L8X0Q7_THACA|nr:hypothetical protein AG1IA_02056 [Rhizoctonia solani AG-1 IA]
MMSTSSVYSRSDVTGSVHAPGTGYGHVPYGHQDMNQLNWFIDDAFPSYDFRLPSFQAELDLLFNSQPTVSSRQQSLSELARRTIPRPVSYARDGTLPVDGTRHIRNDSRRRTFMLARFRI